MKAFEEWEEDYNSLYFLTTSFIKLYCHLSFIFLN